MKEFEKYLKSKGQPPSKLSVNNFTFTKQPLGLNDESKEIVRKAIQRTGSNQKVSIAL